MRIGYVDKTFLEMNRIVLLVLDIGFLLRNPYWIETYRTEITYNDQTLCVDSVYDILF